MARPSHISCVLFDFDGVIVDSEPAAARRNIKIFDRLGVPVTYEDCIALAGCSGEVEIPQIFERYGSSHTLADFRDLYLDPSIASTYADPELAVYEGLRELIGGLREQGVVTGLVSTSRSADIMRALNRFRLMGLFDVVVTGDLVSRRKPDPEPYLYAMELLGAKACETVVFEDSPTGIAAARAAGVYVMGVCVSQVKQDISGADEAVPTYVGLDLMKAGA